MKLKKITAIRLREFIAMLEIMYPRALNANDVLGRFKVVYGVCFQDRHLRAMREQINRDPLIPFLIGSSQRGYYICKTTAEAQEHIVQMEAMRNALSENIAIAKKKAELLHYVIPFEQILNAKEDHPQ